MLLLANIKWRDRPYRVGLAKPALAKCVYDQMLEAFPLEGIMKPLESGGYNKWSLSERNHPSVYKSHVKSHKIWRTFYQYIKSEEFIFSVLREVCRTPANKVLLPDGMYSARFEFSSMPSDGGFIVPHRDIASKVLTLVIPMVRDDGWEESWGGGTDILSPINPQEELLDYNTPLEKFTKAVTYKFEPNQALIFIKSDKSWHSVGPIKGLAGVWRRSLTINIEVAKR
jgi:hypothetical protein